MNSLKKIFSAKAVFLIFLSILDFTFSQSRVALLYSAYTETKSENPKSVIDEITNWELFLMESNIPYKVIYDDDLESGIVDDFDILILPSVENVSTEELESLKLFISNGKSIINVGSKLYTDDNIESDFTNIQTLFGLSELETIGLNNYNIKHSLNLNEINKFNSYETGAIQISNRNKIVVSRVDKNELNVCGYLIHDKSENLKSSIRFGCNDNGKYLWTGFGLNDIVGGKGDFVEFKKLIFNSLIWMDENVNAFTNVKFGSDRIPVLLLIDKNNALESEVLQILDKNGIVFHLVISPTINLNDSLLTKIESEKLIFDLTQFDIDQNSLQKISSIILEIESKYSKKIESVFVNNNWASQESLRFLNEKGVKQIFINSDFNYTPTIENNNQVLIPISKSKSQNTNNILHPIFHTPRFNCIENSEDSLLTLVGDLERNGYTFTTVHYFSDWVIQNKNLVVKSINKINDGFEINIVNNNSSKIDEIKLYMDSFDQNESNDISIKSGNDLLNHNFNPNTGMIEVDVKNIFPKSSKKIVVRLNNE